MCGWKQLLEKMLKNIGILLEQEVSGRKLESFESFWLHAQTKTLNNNKIQK